MAEQQQMARVDVDLETWRLFRIEAISRGRSIADWLGELVEREVAALKGAAARRSEGESPPDPGPRRGSVERATAPTRREQEPSKKRPRNETVAGRQLLTELPHAGSKPPPWEP